MPPSKHLNKLLLNSDVIAVFSPAGIGKTTFIKERFSKYRYLNLKDANAYRLAKDYPAVFFDKNPLPMVLDEIQRLPELLDSILELAKPSEAKQIVLVSSHKIPLPKSLVEPKNIIHLMPISIPEYGTFLSSYIENEVQQLINLKNKYAFETFMRLLARQVAMVVNLNSLSKEVGVSSTTLKSWLDVLEKTFIIYKLPCYFDSFGKRQTKGPKIYFTDTMFAADLAGNDLKDNRLFKNKVVMDILKSRYDSVKEPNMFHFLDNHGFEIDLILQETLMQPIEIEATTLCESPRAEKVRDFFKEREGVKPPIVIHNGGNYSIGGIEFLNVENFLY